MIGDLEITDLECEKINDNYYKAKYLGIECIIDMKTGYINATKFCASASDETRRFRKYTANARYKSLFMYMKKQHEYLGQELSFLVVGGSINYLRGTYLHQDLLIDLASWISPIVYVKIIKILNEWRKISPDNEIKFHKDMDDAMKEGIGMFENNELESVIRDKIAIEEKGVVEVKTEVGFIDLLTDTKIIEVKKYHNWKHALGQVKCYGYFYPTRQKWIYLFNIPTDESSNNTKDTITSTKLINEICESENVLVKYIY